MSWCLITYLDAYTFTLLTLTMTSQIMHHVVCIEQEPLEVREGEGKNKGTRGDGGKTLCVRGEERRMVPGFKSQSSSFPIVFLAYHIFC